MLVGVILSLAAVLAAAFEGAGATGKTARDVNAIPFSKDVSNCSGYTLHDVKRTSMGLVASLALEGKPCNAFGADIAALTVEVSYETRTRLHVKIFDTARRQFQVPESFIQRAAPDKSASPSGSDLEFHYNSHPFEFWITRTRDRPGTTPLFDTRKSSLPATPIPAVRAGDDRTAFPAFNIVFEDQYLEITSALPKNANIYGLGEYYGTSGFRRDTGGSGGSGTVQALMTHDWSVELDRNSYGVHPFYMEHRLNSSGKGVSHGVLVLNSDPGDILLLTPPESDVSLIQYRFLGGILDFYVFVGPSPVDVIEQYGALIGLPLWTPTWAFGFHLCRYGYANLSDWKSRSVRMREANIPLEVQWVDIDFYDRYRDFTTNPENFSIQGVKEFIDDLHSNNQRMIPIVDIGIAITDPSEGYTPHDAGVEQDVFIHMLNGSVTRGNVWPGDTYFPDWFAENTQAWWTDSLRAWRSSGVEFDGIWIDMNEASNFCDGICDVKYDPSSGDVLPWDSSHEEGMTGRAKSGGINFPPYPIHQLDGALVRGSLDASSLHANGVLEYDVHNLFGLGEARATFNALRDIFPTERPFIISRSTFVSAGRWAGHWLGDNHAEWWAMWASIQGMLQFTMFQIPMVGADTCGFIGATTEELCNRWMMLSAFTPFFRNHHDKAGPFQEPYLWESVANASRTAIAARYSLLPYWVTLFADVSLRGTPPLRALFWEFPDDDSLFGVDTQFMIGSALLVTPVLEPGATTVRGVLPGNGGKETWYDFWTRAPAPAGAGNITLPAPLGALNVHVRGGAALLLFDRPAYTTTETRAGPYALLVALDAAGNARGEAYLDDGLSFPPGPSTRLVVTASGAHSVTLAPRGGAYVIPQPLVRIEILGAARAPREVTFNGVPLSPDAWTYDRQTRLLAVALHGANLNHASKLTWTGQQPQNRFRSVSRTASGCAWVCSSKQRCSAAPIICGGVL